jgi:hypothetical protein
MAKAKKPRRKRPKRKIVVNVNLPKGSYKKSGSPVAGLLFANPFAAIIIAVVGIAIFTIIGGLSLPIIIGMFLNPWMWGLSLAVAVIFEPKSNTITILAVLVGLLFWGYGIYMEYLALKPICDIPLVGAIFCGSWNIITFLPKLLMLGLNIMVSFAMIWIVSFIKYELTK